MAQQQNRRDHFHPERAPEDTIERRLSDRVVSFLRDEPPTLYQWYDKYRRTGVGLAPYDVAMGHFLNWRFPAAPVVEVGCGMGQLSAFAALLGHTSVGIEAAHYFHVSERLRSNLMTEWPSLANRFQLIHGTFPTVGADLVTPDTVVVSTQIYYRLDDAVFDALLDAIKPARAFIVSARYFLAPNRCPYERSDSRWTATLFGEIQSRGFGEPQTVYEWTAYEYEFAPDRIVCFERRDGGS